MPDRSESAVPKRSPWLYAAVVVVILGYVATFIGIDGYKVSRSPPGYYGSLTDALVSGQLYLKIEPDPRLALLKNPWESYQGIPRLHDATYFHGRYYIYFGVAPVIILLGPWRLATGTFLSEGAATVIFGFIGFIFGLLILRAWLRRQPKRPSDFWLVLGTLLWGFGTYAFALSQSGNFYGVPILCAFACVMTALFGVVRATGAHTPKSAAGWLALASLCWGLAVASRPHYVFSLPTLVIPLAWLLLRDRGEWARGRRLLLTGAALVPAGFAGALLAWYNYARFGSITEFGFHYQFTSSDQRFIQMWNPSLILPNLSAYTLTDGIYTAYYPLITPTSIMVGIFAWTPFAAVGLLFPLTLLGARWRKDPTWVCVGACALLTAVIHLLALSILPIGADRYDVDFAPELVLAGIATFLAFLELSAQWGKLWRRSVMILTTVLAVISIAKCSLLAFQRSPSADFQNVAARIVNRPAAWIQELFGGVRAPVKLELSFACLKVGVRTALVETGNGRDGMFAQRLDATHVRIGYEHLGNAALYGPAIPFDPQAHQTLVADMGALYPPATHAVFNGWDSNIVDAIHRRVVATIDGAIVLSGNSNTYPSDPFHVLIGEAIPNALSLQPYPGTIYRVSHLHVPTEKQFADTGWHGSVRLHFKFPEFSFPRSEPLLSTGSTNNADMIYVTYLGKGLARFGHDSRDGGGEETASVTFDPAADHTLDIGLGSLEAPPGSEPADEPGLRLRFDGKWLIAMSRRSHPSEAYQVVFGYNSGRMSTAQESFSGPYLRPEHIPTLQPHASVLAGIGPIEGSFRFVPMPSNINEPLVVSGVAGKGDIIYVRYLPEHRALIGVDHWAVGAKTSDPFEVTYDRVYTLAVSSATFLPPLYDPAWGAVPLDKQRELLSTIRVTLNDRVILVAPWAGYPATSQQMAVGLNPIGGSTTGPVFTGHFLEYHRAGIPTFVPNATRDAGNAVKVPLSP